MIFFLFRLQEQLRRIKRNQAKGMPIIRETHHSPPKKKKKEKLPLKTNVSFILSPCIIVPTKIWWLEQGSSTSLDISCEHCRLQNFSYRFQIQWAGW
jgi:hypothetical protein